MFYIILTLYPLNKLKPDKMPTIEEIVAAVEELKSAQARVAELQRWLAQFEQFPGHLSQGTACAPPLKGGGQLQFPEVPEAAEMKGSTEVVVAEAPVQPVVELLTFQGQASQGASSEKTLSGGGGCLSFPKVSEAECVAVAAKVDERFAAEEAERVVAAAEEAERVAIAAAAAAEEAERVAIAAATSSVTKNLLDQARNPKCRVNWIIFSQMIQETNQRDLALLCKDWKEILTLASDVTFAAFCAKDTTEKVTALEKIFGRK